LHLAKYARAVTLLVRGDSFTKSMSSYLVRAIESTPNVLVHHHTEVVDGGGDGSLESITLADRTTDTVEEVPAAALFIMIGGEPHTDWLPDEIARDAHGYLITGRDLLKRPEAHWDHDREPLLLETSVPGVFAAGDVRQGSIKRVASAVGEGATVVRLVHDHLSEDEPQPVANLLS
jgi:thioredoxin reductase (NADPH)